jgi:hypothetical protein
MDEKMNKEEWLKGVYELASSLDPDDTATRKWLECVYDLAYSMDSTSMAIMLKNDRLPDGWEGKTFCHVLAEEYDKLKQQQE